MSTLVVVYIVGPVAEGSDVIVTVWTEMLDLSMVVLAVWARTFEFPCFQLLIRCSIGHWINSPDVVMAMSSPGLIFGVQ
jgi:hypothetical protein